MMRRKKIYEWIRIASTFLIAAAVIATITGFFLVKFDLISKDDFIQYFGVIGSIASLIGLLGVFYGSVPIGDVANIFASRSEYFSLVFSGAENAKKRLWLCVHTLVPSHKDSRVQKLQSNFSDRISDGVDVRLLAPGGVERIEAIYELAFSRGVAVRILAPLEDEDLRCTLVDDDLTLISTKSPGSSSETSTGVSIKSRRLGITLGHYYEQLWLRAIPAKPYLRDFFLTLRDPDLPRNARGISTRFGIPERSVKEIMDFREDESFGVILLVGFPGAGKSVAMGVLLEALEKISAGNIFGVSDYEILKRWFSQRRPGIMPGKEGGFVVKDIGILDSVLSVVRYDVEDLIQKKGKVIIEFSRSNYINAFSILGSEIIDRSLVVYVDAPASLRIDRNNRRLTMPNFPDAGYVPREAMDIFYSSDDFASLRSRFEGRFVVVKNETDRKQDLVEEIEKKVIPLVHVLEAI